VIRDLATLLAQLTPVLHPRPVAIVALEDFRRPEGLAEEDIIATFREPEGLTLYVDAAAAEAAGLEIAMRAAWITLEVASALEAVGFTAAFSAALTQAGVACNVVAAARRDHVFVPWARADDAMRALQGIAGKRTSFATGES
jgi:hypothetical protein